MQTPEILYEDDEVLVVNKPPGLSVHPDGRTSAPVLTDWLLKKYPEIKEVGEPFKKKDGSTIPRPGIVHRLDKDTSGLLIVAKTQKAYEQLKKQFKNRDIKKTYTALVYGNPKKDAGIIVRPIGTSAKDFRLRSAYPTARGELREAETAYKVLRRFTDPHTNEPYALLELRPKTGRTHQIRVHLQAEGHPVVCDSLYARGKNCPISMGRLALHAEKLTLKLPSGGQETFHAPIPKDFEDTVAFFEKDQ